MANVSDPKNLEFSPSSNRSIYTIFDLRKVLDVEALNVTFELPNAAAHVVVGDKAWATFHRSVPTSVFSIHPTITPSVLTVITGKSLDMHI